MSDTPDPAFPEEPPAVDIHKPKPIHNWREFLTELGTIVLGICIALAGEQTLEWLHWRGQVQDARAVITSETTYNLVGAIARIRSLGCAERRLDAIAGILDEASRSGSLPPVGSIGGPVRHSWRSGAWDSVVASQTATHFPPEQLAALSSLYKRVQRGEEFATRELEAWSHLYAMVGPGRRLDPASEADLRASLSIARDMGRTVATTSRFVINEAAALDLPFTPAERQQLAEIRSRPLTDQNRLALGPDSARADICDPIGAVPASYGQALGGSIASRISESEKSLPDFSKPAP